MLPEKTYFAEKCTIFTHIHLTKEGICLLGMSQIRHFGDRSYDMTQALHGLAPKCKLINMHELINKSTNDYVTLLPCKNGANVNNKG